MSRIATASQTVGPYFSIGLAPLYRSDLAAGVSGRRISVGGHVYDADGQGVADCVLELWQADALGRYDSSFNGFGRIATDAKGAYGFTTILPGRVEGPDGGLQAPHILVSVFMRGILKRAVTRIYFGGDGGNHQDFVLDRVPAARRSTLIATNEGGDTWRWDVRMQGPAETVFFDI